MQLERHALIGLYRTHTRIIKVFDDRRRNGRSLVFVVDQTDGELRGWTFFHSRGPAACAAAAKRHPVVGRIDPLKEHPPHARGGQSDNRIGGASHDYRSTPRSLPDGRCTL